MVKVDSTDRVAFLAEQFNVFTQEDYENMAQKRQSGDYLENIIEIKGHTSGEVLALVESTSRKTGEYNGRTMVSYKKTVKVSEDIFGNMVAADPTPNKIYVQWMLNVFSRFIKSDELEEAVRFVEEDLPQANAYLSLFENNKRKKLFKQVCASNSALLKIQDPTNINQYRNLAQVFDVVDPFIERDSSSLEKTFKMYVDLGEAEMPVRDRNFTLYIPKSLNANVALEKFASWCTTRQGNGMVKNYTENYKKPDGTPSKLYVIIDNKLYSNQSNEVYQLHFESNQIMNRQNSQEKNFYDKVLNKSEALSNYFYDELMKMAKMYGNNPNPKENIYLKHLINFGHAEALFDVLDDTVPTINIPDHIISKLPDVSRFKNLGFLYLNGCRLKKLDESICQLDKLQVLSIPNNEITTLPSYLGHCKNLVALNIVGNKITHIADEIAGMDPSNGGKLVRVSAVENEVGKENYEKLKRLLPNVMVTAGIAQN